MQVHQQRKTADSSFEGAEIKMQGQGPMLSPPPFKLDASKARSWESEEEDIAATENGTYIENVSNLALLTWQVQNAATNGEVDWLARSLEALKHDPVEVAHFRKYFQDKIGLDLQAYLEQYLGEEAASDLNSSLDNNKDTYSAVEIAETVHEYLENGETQDMVVLLSFIADIKAASDAYKERYEGRDMYTDITAASTDAYDFTIIANKVFGKVQNNEKVVVHNEKEAAEAREIIARIFDQYGIEINSQKSLDTLLEDRKAAPNDMKKQIKTASWTLEELRDLEKAIANYSNFLDPHPSDAVAYEKPRALSSIGRLNKDILISETNAYYPSENVSGEAFYEQENITLFDNMHEAGYSDRYKSEKKDPETGLSIPLNKTSGQGNVMTHELAHAILHKHVDAFMMTSGFWVNSAKHVPASIFVDPKNNDPISEFKVRMASSTVPPRSRSLTLKSTAPLKRAFSD